MIKDGACNSDLNYHYAGILDLMESGHGWSPRTSTMTMKMTSLIHRNFVTLPDMRLELFDVLAWLSVVSSLEELDRVIVLRGVTISEDSNDEEQSDERFHTVIARCHHLAIMIQPFSERASPPFPTVAEMDC